MPVARFTHNLIKIGKNQYRNSIYLTKEWNKTLNTGEYASAAALADHFRVSRARVTQILNLLELSPEAIKLITSLGDQLSSPIVSERKLRTLLWMTVEQQVEQVRILISKK